MGVSWSRRERRASAGPDRQGRRPAAQVQGRLARAPWFQQPGRIQPVPVAAQPNGPRVPHSTASKSSTAAARSASTSAATPAKQAVYLVAPGIEDRGKPGLRRQRSVGQHLQRRHPTASMPGEAQAHLTVAMPMRSPVKEPGRSPPAGPGQQGPVRLPETGVLLKEMRRSEWAWGMRAVAASNLPSGTRATEAHIVAVSTASVNPDPSAPPPVSGAPGPGAKKDLPLPGAAGLQSVQPVRGRRPPPALPLQRTPRRRR